MDQPLLFDELEPALGKKSRSATTKKAKVVAATGPVQAGAARIPISKLARHLGEFSEFGKKTLELTSEAASFEGAPIEVPTFVNEYWTSKQRAASSLHEVSYRACFKPQLPRFFIERLTDPGDRVYDPFMGRGTTPLEAALLGRVPVGCDVNPLAVQLVRPRITPPRLEDVEARLQEISLSTQEPVWEELLAFYHPETLQGLTALKSHLQKRRESGKSDALDDWITMVALNRLTGHSAGFFSVYTLPPNQAASIKSQLRINAKRNQTPPPRDLRKIILKKSKQLLGECGEKSRALLASVAAGAQFVTSTSDHTPAIASDSIDLVVTSPPFLDVVQYAADNWLRCWFLGINPADVKITMAGRLPAWQETMTSVFRELHRVLKPGGAVAFEVGEVAKGKIKLELASLPCAVAAGLKPVLILINDQIFTKTANCWGVDNNGKGTNTNRVLLLTKA